MHKQLDEALKQGAMAGGAFEGRRLPIFPRAITECTTADSSPYLVSLDTFSSLYGQNQHRSALLSDLASFIERSKSVGVRISAILVGGSFLDRKLEKPRDIDCLAYYEIDKNDNAEAIILAWNDVRRQSKADAKICPIDTGAVAIIKRSIFFSNLFSIDKLSGQLSTGTLLVELN